MLSNQTLSKSVVEALRFCAGRCLLALAMTGAAVAEADLHYGSSAEDTRWQVSGSIFECRFEQPIPGYGRAVFYHEAGEDVEFRLETLRNLMAYTPAEVTILPPPWQPSAKSEHLGQVKVVDATPNLSLDARRTNQFLHALLEGKWPAISHTAYYDKGRQVRVHVSAVAFNDFYPVYLQCVDQLLPMNFRQVNRLKVLFGSGEEKIDADDMAILDQIIHYIQNDPRVFAVYLDGHADNLGRRYDNRQISKARVEDVERYFITRGVNPDMLTTRFHGDRYPVADNRTAAGRAENRRVTIRLEQRQDMPVPDNLIFRPQPVVTGGLKPDA